MNCLNCKHWSMRGRPEMAREGLAACLLGPKWHYRPPHYRCNEFQAEDGEKVLKRIEWLSKLKRLGDER